MYIAILQIDGQCHQIGGPTPADGATSGKRVTFRASTTRDGDAVVVYLDGQALHYGDVTGQQPVLALISAYDNIFGAEQQKLEYVSGLCAAHGVEVWALTTRRQ